MTSKSNNSRILPPVAGVKRPAPNQLLPAFEPTASSSPQLPRPTKRINRSFVPDRDAAIPKYPTPLPTSSTGILSSSPPPIFQTRPGLQRTQSNVSERAPLCVVPSITLPEDGQPVLMGRSSNSSHYQLSANRLISRVHVRAAYLPADTGESSGKIEVTCLGWNGVKVHCQGRAWDLSKGDKFTSETEHDVMLDVHHARVLLSWPDLERKGALSTRSDSTVDGQGSPWHVSGSFRAQAVNSSPVRRGQPPKSPVSPSPAGPPNVPSSSTVLPSDVQSGQNLVSVYEDERSFEEDPAEEPSQCKATQSTQVASQALCDLNGASQVSETREPEHFSDQDEENDPIIASFGPQGHNILPRMASFTTADTPDRVLRRRAPKDPLPTSRPQAGLGIRQDADANPIANHVVNQLAFSRLSSTPLSTILQNLPGELEVGITTRSKSKPFSKEDLEATLESLPSVGSVRREGKDAAGKPLESEYYYIPDMDPDTSRREAVVNALRKPGIRACRKQHKQYYWRRPKTP